MYNSAKFGATEKFCPNLERFFQGQFLCLKIKSMKTSIIRKISKNSTKKFNRDKVAQVEWDMFFKTRPIYISIVSFYLIKGFLYHSSVLLLLFSNEQ